jgi:hypothetical protein
MKKIIDGKTYNTETAERIGTWDNGLGYSDFRYCEEALYMTKKGAFFIKGEGGAMTIWSESNGNTSWGGSGIRPVTETEALTWCEKGAIDADVIEKYFTVDEA